MNTRRWAAFLLLLLPLLAFSFVACDDDNPSTGSDPADDDNDATPSDDDDNDDDDDDNDDFTPPAPVYGYYQEGDPGNWDWLHEQLAVFATYDFTLFLGMDSVDLGNTELAALIRAADDLGVEVRA